MQDPSPVHVLWDIHDMRADVLKQKNMFARFSSCSIFLLRVGKTDWILRFFMNCDNLYFNLRRKSSVETEEIALECDIYLLTSDGSLWRKVKETRKFILNGDLLNEEGVFLISRQELLDNSKVLIDRGVVHLSVHLRPFGLTLPRPLTFCVKSRAGICRKILWKVERVSGIWRGEERECTLENLDYRFVSQISIKLIVFLKEGKVCVRMENVSSCQKFFILCETVCIMQAEGSFESNLKCWNGCKILKTADANSYLAFIEAARLTGDSSSFIKNDNLKIFFQLMDYSTYMTYEALEVVEGDICSTKILTNTISPAFEAVQTHSRGVSNNDSLERGHPDCPIGSDFQSLLQDETLSDFKLKVGDESIAVHKAVLCARSVVLKAMLESPMRESCNNEMDVPDFQPGTVQRLVRFLYSGSVPDLNCSTAYELYEAADKYAVFSLRALCSRAMVSGLGVSNICGVLSLSDRHQDTDLKARIMDFIQPRKQEVFSSQEWLAFMKEDPLLALEVYHHHFVEK